MQLYQRRRKKTGGNAEKLSGRVPADNHVPKRNVGAGVYHQLNRAEYSSKRRGSVPEIVWTESTVTFVTAFAVDAIVDTGINGHHSFDNVLGPLSPGGEHDCVQEEVRSECAWFAQDVAAFFDCF